MRFESYHAHDRSLLIITAVVIAIHLSILGLAILSSTMPKKVKTREATRLVVQTVSLSPPKPAPMPVTAPPELVPEPPVEEIVEAAPVSVPEPTPPPEPEPTPTPPLPPPPPPTPVPTPTPPKKPPAKIEPKPAPKTTPKPEKKPTPVTKPKPDPKPVPKTPPAPPKKVTPPTPTPAPTPPKPKVAVDDKKAKEAKEAKEKAEKEKQQQQAIAAEKQRVEYEKQQALITQAQERIANIGKNRDKIGSIASSKSAISEGPKSIAALEIDTLNTAGGPPLSDKEVSYLQEVASRLKLQLRLPQYGEVNIKLTLQRSGKVAKVIVTSAESNENKKYVEKTVPTLNFPSFGSQLGNVDEYTFSFILRNE